MACLNAKHTPNDNNVMLRLSFIAVMLVKPKRRGSIRSETTYGLKNFLYHTYTIEESVTSDPVCVPRQSRP